MVKVINLTVFVFDFLCNRKKSRVLNLRGTHSSEERAKNINIERHKCSNRMWDRNIGEFSKVFMEKEAFEM